MDQHIVKADGRSVVHCMTTGSVPSLFKRQQKKCVGVRPEIAHTLI